MKKQLFIGNKTSAKNDYYYQFEDFRVKRLMDSPRNTSKSILRGSSYYLIDTRVPLIQNNFVSSVYFLDKMLTTFIFDITKPRSSKFGFFKAIVNENKLEIDIIPLNQIQFKLYKNDSMVLFGLEVE